MDQEGVEDVNSAEDSDSSSQTSLNASYNSLPLSALAHASSRLDSTNDELNDDERKVNRAQALAKAKEDLWQKQQAKRGKSDTNKPDKVFKDTKDKHKRANKHAPTEITSRKPTSRKRDVVDVDKVVRYPFRNETHSYATFLTHRNLAILASYHSVATSPKTCSKSHSLS